MKEEIVTHIDSLKVVLLLNLTITFLTGVFLTYDLVLDLIVWLLFCILIIGTIGIYRYNIKILQWFYYSLILWIALFTIMYYSSYIFADQLNDISIHRCSYDEFRLLYCNKDEVCITNCNDNIQSQCYKSCIDDVKQHLLIESMTMVIIIIGIYMYLTKSVYNLINILKKYVPNYNHIIKDDISTIKPKVQ